MLIFGRYKLHAKYANSVSKERKQIGESKYGVTGDPLFAGLFEFWDALHISGTDRARNFKFGIQIDHEGLIRNKIKIRSKGSRRNQVTYF